MAIVELQRLPPSVKMPKLMYSIRGILRKERMNGNFWITEIADMRTGDYKEAKLEFPTKEEAWSAMELLDEYPFRNGNDHSMITARIVGEKHNNKRRKPSPYRNRSSNRSRSRSRGDFYNRYSMERDRSRSPLYRVTSELDLELELLRKKRLVIEEERRLLEEQKKLEMLRERGPRFYDVMERSRDRKKRPRREMDEAIRNGRPHKPHLPRFKKPCYTLIDQMSSLIDKHSTSEEKKTLIKVIVAQLRRRLAVELENKDFIPANKIVELYRSKYPQSTDEEFIMPMIENLRLSHWSLSNPKKKDNDQKNNQMEISRKAQVDPGSSSRANMRDNSSDTCEPNIKIKEELNKLVTEETAIAMTTTTEVASGGVKREPTVAESKTDTTIVDGKKKTTTVVVKKEVTTTEGKKSTTTTAGGNETTTTEGKKTTISEEEKKMATAAEGDKETPTTERKETSSTAEGKKETIAQGKTETTTEGNEKVTTTIDGKKTATAVGKKNTTTIEGNEKETTIAQGKKETSTAEVMVEDLLEGPDAEMLGAADEDWIQDGVDWTDEGESEEEEADENVEQ